MMIQIVVNYCRIWQANEQIISSCSQCSEATTTEHDEIDGGVVQYLCNCIVSSQTFPEDSSVENGTALPNTALLQVDGNVTY